MYGDDDFLALSGIQHFSFCRRQWALIHIERIWSDNLLTVQGEMMHERAHDEGLRERRGDVLVVRGLTVRSAQMGVWGKCDVVEFHQDPTGHPLNGEDGLWKALPVEYKHGKTKVNDADRLQLCAQAMCLEEMLASHIDYGCLYYGSTHSRERIDFSEQMRSDVRSLFSEMHQLFARHHVPQVKQFPACRSCSLFENCIPKASNRNVDAYINRYVKDLL
ncbi:MAG: CRISPR-associated protein Cas4 [Atopobiaceae bacterium]|nr:CRISPR-associated protein Cas4 [Atopobiaceae bacterium]